MRTLFILSIASLSLLFSCKPDKSENPEKINTSDPKSLSAALKLWHGSRMQGTSPAPNNNAAGPRLDQQSNNQVIKAVAGKYAVIQPEVSGGNVAGYYAKVNGANDFFKIDYKKPREGGRKSPRFSRHNLALSKGLGIDSTGSGTLDSSIVVILPSNIQPGQFCMTYWAYDSLGNVSNGIAVCISVLSFGGDASSSYLNGIWHMTGVSSDTAMGWEPATGSADTVYTDGYCVNNHLVDSFGNGPLTYPVFIFSITKADLVFGNSGGLKYTYAETLKDLNYTLSSCSNYVFNSQTETDNLNGAWSYNSSTGRIVLIFDFDDNGNASPEAYEYKLIKLNNNKVYLHDQDYDDFIRMEK